jgi:hypothetical protein
MYAVGTSVRSDQRRCSKAEGLLGLTPILNMKSEIFMVVSIFIVLLWATTPYSMIVIYQFFSEKNTTSTVRTEVIRDGKFLRRWGQSKKYAASHRTAFWLDFGWWIT